MGGGAHNRGGLFLNPTAPGGLGKLMSIDSATVRKVAKLAHIKLAEERIAPLAAELNAIVGWIEQLNELETDHVAPMTSAVAATLPLREDMVTEGGDASLILANAPQARDGYFVVPKVVE